MLTRPFWSFNDTTEAASLTMFAAAPEGLPGQASPDTESNRCRDRERESKDTTNTNMYIYIYPHKQVVLLD